MNQTNNNTRNTGGPEPGGNSDKHPIYLADYPGEALLFTTGGVMVTRKNDVNVTQTRPVNIIQLEDEREKKKPGHNLREFTVNSVTACQVNKVNTPSPYFHSFILFSHLRPFFTCKSKGFVPVD